uniref:Uncharacterized protein n=1 Tax=Arundo donax TaxID=35708 RepID=A0A0A9DVU0_ARUDO
MLLLTHGDNTRQLPEGGDEEEDEDTGNEE